MLDVFTNLGDYQPVQSVPYDPSPSIECLHEQVCQYQIQSPAHFVLGLAVQQASSPYGKTIDRGLKGIYLTTSLGVLMHGNSIEGRITVPVQCQLRRTGRRSREMRWDYLLVSHRGTAEALDTFLASTFPAIDGPLKSDILWNWWLSNSKSFNWTALPIELKQRVIEQCMHQPLTYGVYAERLARFNWRYKPDHKIRKPGPFEVVDQLGDWFPLPYVSHQIRAITIRLCIIGGSSLMHPEGLCITASCYKGLCDRIDRLGDYYQMTSSSSIPISPAQEMLSKCYEHFPKIYPQLSQYATLRHGIQKISLGMDFLSYMHFFKVTVGGLQQYRKAKALTYEVFGRLPCLNEIVIRLPLRPYGGWRDKPGQAGPQLWHEDSPCPGFVHRVIYERITEVLAGYNVTVQNFIDYAEMKRYEAARLNAQKALKLTKTELEELYADGSGGVELAISEREPSIELEKARRRVEEAGAKEVQVEFFSPTCHCDEPCILARVLTARKDNS
ncbi:uncharacterized protein M421DRAFT_88339 [Didymella exigua CBS 183.55]|uniref:Uncharacterized protein n=1 Tax=Didymella exigua CBS 183.55 TaxID=1150837 RepID=A0A6A5S420_9PLEO|nr:uncharacterized protein M421DRAFT_88339 [Didymella exigua CBS 183.55]KAF1934370.1 hypothetical protein M421DRAFT_88339 [Didymella exigua CBS 183.55]